MGGRCRRVKSGDREELFSLFSEALSGWDSSIGPARWNWLHLDNPFAAESGVPAWICIEKGNIAVNVSLLLSKFKLDEKTVIGGWLVDVIRNPGSKGLISLPRLTLEMEGSVDFLAGLGLSEDAMKFARAFRWILPGTVPRFVKILYSLPYIDSMLPGKILPVLVSKGLDFSLGAGNFSRKVIKSVSRSGGCPDGEEIDVFDDETNELWKILAPRFRFIVERKKDYLNWKYVRQPGLKYNLFFFRFHGEPAGYSVLRTMGENGMETGLIVDIFSFPRFLPCILEHAESFFRKRKTAKIVIFSSHPEIIGAISACGFKQRPSMMRFTYSPRFPSVKPAGMEILSNWFISKADSDQDRPVA